MKEDVMHFFRLLPFRLRIMAVASAAAVLAVPGLATSALRPTGGLEAPAAAGSAHRPLALGQVEAFSEGKVLVSSYGLSYFCPTEAFADLNPPNSNGNGVPAAADPAEFQVPQCVVGDSGTGSVPTVGPTGVPVAEVPGLWGIVPAFGGLGPNTLDPETNTHVDTQCPEPGPPTHVHRGQETTCTMHPSALHAAHVEGQGPDPAPLPRHSHIFDKPSPSFTWYQGRIVFVYDPNIWPDRDGNCRAGARRCLTSLEALRVAQANGQAGRDEPTNLFFFIKTRPLAR
jgi:hypothetical protein